MKELIKKYCDACISSKYKSLDYDETDDKELHKFFDYMLVTYDKFFIKDKASTFETYNFFFIFENNKFQLRSMSGQGTAIQLFYLESVKGKIPFFNLDSPNDCQVTLIQELKKQLVKFNNTIKDFKPILEINIDKEVYTDLYAFIETDVINDFIINSIKEKIK